MNACLKEIPSPEKPLNRLVRELGRKILAQYPTMDCGGCGVYAAALGEQLQLAGAQDVSVWAAALDGYLDVDIGEARRRIKNHASVRAWARQGVQFVHLGVEYTWDSQTWHVDSIRMEQIYPDQDLFGLVYAGRLTLDETRALVAQPKGWNCQFDRSLIPAIQRSVQHAFEQFGSLHLQR